MFIDVSFIIFVFSDKKNMISVYNITLNKIVVGHQFEDIKQRAMESLDCNTLCKKGSFVFELINLILIPYQQIVYYASTSITFHNF